MGSWDSSGWCDTGPGRAPPKRQEERGIAAQQRATGGNEPGGAGEARHLGGDAGEAGACIQRCKRTALTVDTGRFRDTDCRVGGWKKNNLVFVFVFLIYFGDVPGGPVAKTLSSLCRWPEFDPWSGN